MIESTYVPGRVVNGPATYIREWLYSAARR